MQFQFLRHRTPHQKPSCVDNAAIHTAFAADALDETRTNLGSGGKQPNMRNERMGDVTVQPTRFADTHPDVTLRGDGGIGLKCDPFESYIFTLLSLSGLRMGLEVGLTERSLWKDGMCLRYNVKCRGSTICCARNTADHKHDSMEQKSMLEELIVADGHMITFIRSSL